GSAPEENPVPVPLAAATILSTPVRKFALTVHLRSSVGWIGAVFAYLALGVAAASNSDTQTVRAARRTRGVGQVCRFSFEMPLLEQARQAHEAGTLVSEVGCPVRRLARVRARHVPTLLHSAPGP